MNKNAQEVMKEEYERIGKLTDEQFLAAQVVNCNKPYLKDVKRIETIERDGKKRAIDFEELNEKEFGTLRIHGTMSNLRGGDERTGWFTIENVRDAQFDPRTGFLLIDSDKYNLVCSQEIDKMNHVLGDKNNDFTKEVLREIIPRDAKIEDYKEVRDLMEREVELGFEFDNGWSLDDIMNEGVEEESCDDLTLSLGDPDFNF